MTLGQRELIRREAAIQLLAAEQLVALTRDCKPQVRELVGVLKRSAMNTQAVLVPRKP